MNLNNLSLEDADWIFNLYRTSPVVSMDQKARLNNIHSSVFADRFQMNCDTCVQQAYIRLLDVSKLKISQSEIVDKESIVKDFESTITKIKDDAKPKGCSACKGK
jgi:hypothetical protein